LKRYLLEELLDPDQFENEPGYWPREGTVRNTSTNYITKRKVALRHVLQERTFFDAIVFQEGYTVLNTLEENSYTLNTWIRQERCLLCRQARWSGLSPSLSYTSHGLTPSCSYYIMLILMKFFS
jgi:hypothetical protein